MSKKMNRIQWICILFGLSLTVLGCTQGASSVDVSSLGEKAMHQSIPDPEENLVDIIAERTIRKNELTLSIDKSEYTLSVLYRGETLIVYPCVFGFNALDDKAQEGDGCTPEGTFGIRDMYPHKSWKFFIWIDYPNKESWRRFEQRKANGEIEASATIGGEIGIHGVPEGGDKMIENQTNWTLGCISLKNKHMTDLYHSLSKEVKVEIVK